MPDDLMMHFVRRRAFDARSSAQRGSMGSLDVIRGSMGPALLPLAVRHCQSIAAWVLQVQSPVVGGPRDLRRRLRKRSCVPGSSLRVTRTRVLPPRVLFVCESPNRSQMTTLYLGLASPSLAL
jgi:hypothetical protein